MGARGFEPLAPSASNPTLIAELELVARSYAFSSAFEYALPKRKDILKRLGQIRRNAENLRESLQATDSHDDDSHLTIIEDVLSHIGYAHKATRDGLGGIEYPQAFKERLINFIDFLYEA